MATPLLMIGPGGDYQARYYVKGVALAKQVGRGHAHQGDDESAGGFAGYERQQARRQDGRYPEPESVAPSGRDAFEHTEPVALPTYAPATIRGAGRPAAKPLAMASAAVVPAASVAAAAEAWLAAQHRTLVAIPLFTPAPAAAQPRPLRPRLAPAAEPVHRPQPVGYRPAAWPRPAAPSVLHNWLAPSLNTESNADADLVAVTTAPETFHEPHPQAASHPHPHPRPSPGAGLLAHHAGAGRRAGRLQGDGLRARRGAHQKGSALARPQQGSLFNS